MTKLDHSSGVGSAFRRQASCTVDALDAARAWANGDARAGAEARAAAASAETHRRAVQHELRDDRPGALAATVSAELDGLLRGVMAVIREAETLGIQPAELGATEMIEAARTGALHLVEAIEAEARVAPAAPAPAPEFADDVVAAESAEADPTEDAPPGTVTPVDAGQPPGGMRHIRALDGLRGAAVLAVVAYHFAPDVLPGGFLGVDVFFVLSGFLITSLLVTEWTWTRRVHLPAFWARRVRRLIPAMLCVLLFVGIVAALDPDQVGARHVADDGLAAFTYLANWHFIDVGQSYIQEFLHQDPSPLRHMWSLAIEEQFYIAWPLLFALVGGAVALSTKVRASRPRNVRVAIVSVSLVLAALSIWQMLALYRGSSDPNRVYYGTDSRAHLLLFGAALGALTSGAPAIADLLRRRTATVLGTIAALGILALTAVADPGDAWLYQGGYPLIGVAVVAVLVASAQEGRTVLRRILESRVLVGLGLVSYGVYLWHWPATVWLNESATGLDGVALFGLRAAATTVAALASYYLIELPIRHRRVRLPRTSRPGIVPATIVTIVAVLLLVPALTFPALVEAPETAVAETTAQVTSEYASAPRCDGAPTVGAPDATAGDGLRVALIGNSIAEEIEPCLESILEDRGATFDAVTENGLALCHFYDDIQQQANRPAAERPDVALLFSAPAPCNEPDDWEVQVRRAVRVWTDAGIHVYLVPYVPPPPDRGGPGGQPIRKFAQLDGRNTSPKGLARVYASIARDEPSVTVLDAGTFLRDGRGRPQWRMPCLPNEPGCGDDGALVVRFPADGIHFCADSGWLGSDCPASAQAGERRAAAALAQQVLALHAPAVPPPDR